MRETPKAAAAYREYEAMGDDRSISKLAQKYANRTSKVRQFQRWSAEHHWQERIRQYEDTLLAERRKKRAADLEKMDERHATIGQLNAMIAVNRIDALSKLGEIGASAAVSLLRVATELERLARGGITSRVEADVSILPKEYLNIAPDEEGSEP